MKKPFDVTSLENDSDLDEHHKVHKRVNWEPNWEEIQELEEFYNSLKNNS